MNSLEAISSKLGELQYLVLPAKLGGNSPYEKIHNSAYQYFKNFWSEIFQNNGVKNEASFEQDFFRMDFITLLLHDDAIAGLHLYCLFNLNLDCHREHPYFKLHHGEVFLNALKTQGLSSALTMEYFTIHPAWRKKEVGLSLGPILGSLGTRIQLACGAHASLTRAREDVGSNRMFEDLGGRTLQSNLPMYNTPVSLMAAFSNEVKELSDFTSRRLVEKYWTERIDISALSIKQPAPFRVA